MNTQFPTKTSEIKEKFNKYINKNLIDYGSKRNFDLGPPHTNVSTLSPYIGRRLISETDILDVAFQKFKPCLLYTSPNPRDRTRSRMPSSA